MSAFSVRIDSRLIKTRRGNGINSTLFIIISMLFLYSPEYWNINGKTSIQKWKRHSHILENVGMSLWGWVLVTQVWTIGKVCVSWRKGNGGNLCQGLNDFSGECWNVSGGDLLIYFFKFPAALSKNLKNRPLIFSHCDFYNNLFSMFQNRTYLIWTIRDFRIVRICKAP